MEKSEIKCDEFYAMSYSNFTIRGKKVMRLLYKLHLFGF